MSSPPVSNQSTGSVSTTDMHHFTTTKFAQSISATPTNGTQLGQVVGVLSGGEGGVHYLRPVEGSAGFQALPHQTSQQQLITLPITIPGAKPGDPQQTVQIQVMNPNVTTLSPQVSMHQPKYQMAHIPIQSFPQSEIGTVLTVAYPPQDNSDAVQIIGNASLSEGIQVVAALQPQDVQMLAAHLPIAEHLITNSNKNQNSDDASQQQTIQISALIPQHFNITIEDTKKSANNNNNNNNTFRIKQENVSGDESPKEEIQVQQVGQQWTLTSSNADIAEYLSRVPGVTQLQQFLKFNSETKTLEPTNETQGNSQKDTKDDGVQQTEGNEAETPPVKTKKKKKYKKKPPKPKKPKPGQVVIATALDGTLLYCCPECHMAYPEKEFLEQHLAGHKIERRYICGICGAGLKRREHLERHKLGHNPARPYVCSVCHKGFKRKEHLNLHFVIHSGEKTEICQECGKGFYRKDHLRKHARSHEKRAERAREELAHQQSQISQATPTTSNDSNKQASTNALLTNIQPEMTILVPTSTTSVPIQITLPHLVSMNSGASTTSTTEAINIKQEIDGMLIQ